ncbi:DNA primase [Sulfolobales archaeon HS-7]|nr:DNA primase [Sulfolobales archaeon HS-7]
MRYTSPQEWINITRQIFREYYSSANFQLPDDMSLREFAFQLMDREGYVRNLQFLTQEQFKNFVRENIPFHMFYSVGKYRNPASKEFEDMNWLGSDLLFDLDADEICEGNQISLNNAQMSLQYVDLTVECLNKVYAQAKQLRDIIENDFGLNYTIHFSGNRGFHVVVYCDLYCSQLTNKERKEIAYYVKTKGIAIDEQVTIDIRRLIRIPGSLNGKAGLLVTIVEDNFIPSFNTLSPFTEFIATFLPYFPLKISPLGFKVEMIANQRIKIPLSVALYLHLKGLGEIIAYT